MNSICIKKFKPYSIIKKIHLTNLLKFSKKEKKKKKAYIYKGKALTGLVVDDLQREKKV